MWKIGKHYWLNPDAIAYAHDFPREDKIRVFFCGNGDSALYTAFEGEERQQVLACLAQHTVTYPRLVHPDEPPF